MKYVMLTNKDDYGTILKLDNQIQYVYSDEKGWVQTTIMLDYFLPYGKHYDMYVEITEEKAKDLIRLIKAVSIWGD